MEMKAGVSQAVFLFPPQVQRYLISYQLMLKLHFSSLGGFGELSTWFETNKGCELQQGSHYDAASG